MERRNNHNFCQTFTQNIDAFLDSEMDAGARAEFEAHAGDCEECKEALAFAQSVQRGLANLPAQTFSRERSKAVIAEARREYMRAFLVKITHHPSFPRRRKSIDFSRVIDSRLRGNDITKNQKTNFIAWKAKFFQPLVRWIAPRPLVVAVSFAAILLIVMFSLPKESGQPEFSPEELAKAEREIKWTLAYLGDISERTSLLLRDDVIDAHVITPIQENMFKIRDSDNKARP